ncbi:MAG: DUF4238 domain-containing protein [Thalassospira sp.]|uniref:DUF4238 domain-containing protein n=1 Tax=Thalassospira sp. TaxID=1912094 RepID=UPI0032EAB68E
MLVGYRRNHHYVPEFLLRQWSVRKETGDDVLLAYSWSSHKAEVALKSNLGPSGYCYGRDLLTLPDHPLGQDHLECGHFEEIDRLGSNAHLKLLSDGVEGVSREQKEEFVKFLLSLEARRPDVLSRIRTSGVAGIKQQLDDDVEIKSELARFGTDESPTQFYEKTVGSVENETVSTVVEYLTEDSIGLPAAMNSYWGIKKFSGSLKLVLSDRPLIRHGVSGAKNSFWALPLSPDKLLILSPSDHVFHSLISRSPGELVRKANISSVSNCDRYVFGTSWYDQRWLKKLFDQRGPHAQ